MVSKKKFTLTFLLLCSSLIFLLPLVAHGPEPGLLIEKTQQISDHYDGSLFFNPGYPSSSSSSQSNPPRRGVFWYLWRWLFINDQPEWPELKNFSPGPPPADRVPEGSLRLTTVGHATFLIQIDGINILTDPIWSDRCGPVSWAGPKRHQPPGIRFEDLPPIDTILISHNHYDHLDFPTLERLAGKGTPMAIVPLGNLSLVQKSGIPVVHEIDWGQSVALSSKVKVTLVPAQHFSSRTPWDRNKTLWGGFVISGPSGNVYFAGDTGYGPHFREIARRFSKIRIALLPISPFRTQQSKDQTPSHFSMFHMRPAEAVQAHLDLEADLSLATHFRVFQLGWDGFDDAVLELALTLKKRHINPNAFIAPSPGQMFDSSTTLVGLERGRTLAKIMISR